MKLKILAVALFTILLTSCSSNDEQFNEVNYEVAQPKSLKNGTQQEQFRQSRTSQDTFKVDERYRAKNTPKVIDPDKLERPR